MNKTVNLHITLTRFTHESRVLKETKSIIRHGLADRVRVAALGDYEVEEREMIDGQRFVQRFRLKSRALPRDIFSQTIKYIEFFFKVLFTYKRVDIVNCHSLACLPIGAFVKFFRGALLVYDPHELETEVSGLSGVRKKLSEIFENIFIRYADSVITVSHSISDIYSEKYEIEKPSVVMNTPFVKRIDRQNLFRQKLDIPEDKIIFLYQGGLAPNRGIELLVETFKKVSDPKRVIVFLGFGPLEDYVKAEAEHCDQIYFMDAVSPQELSNYTSSADYGLLAYENCSLNNYLCSPNKLFEYLMSGLPVIITDLKDMRKIVEAKNLGYVADKFTIESMVQLVEKIDHSKWDQLSANCKKASSIYNWENQEKEICNVFREIESYRDLNSQLQSLNEQNSPS